MLVCATTLHVNNVAELLEERTTSLDMFLYIDLKMRSTQCVTKRLSSRAMLKQHVQRVHMSISKELWKKVQKDHITKYHEKEE